LTDQSQTNAKVINNYLILKIMKTAIVLCALLICFASCKTNLNKKIVTFKNSTDASGHPFTWEAKPDQDQEYYEYPMIRCFPNITVDEDYRDMISFNSVSWSGEDCKLLNLTTESLQFLLHFNAGSDEALYRFWSRTGDIYTEKGFWGGASAEYSTVVWEKAQRAGFDEPKFEVSISPFEIVPIGDKGERMLVYSVTAKFYNCPILKENNFGARWGGGHRYKVCESLVVGHSPLISGTPTLYTGPPEGPIAELLRGNFERE
jgi:hypothetical protein